ncbi:sodium-driven chloride bicarbonate exchanger [Bufo bufo]|uniref:sodium-driven chloride bicarbonate exchanger n=1 Tax=Bufo bufo TaxID=8384 RepID=UPI001ABDB8A1|nr:sodium-driven chloride bicarbonate exchanger [Bufo bufo]
MILDQQVASGQLSEDVRHRVHEALLKRHYHQNQKKLSNRIPIVRSFADIGKKQSEPHSMDKNAGQLVSPQSAPSCIEPKTDVSRENSTLDVTKFDLHFMKKIPAGAEASNILVGELEFLDRAVVAFVRLSPAVLLSGLTEVPIPSRFLFILLGPLGKGQQYHEIGRSIATLMTDEVFHDVAYKAKDRNDLVSGIDEFLDQVTVLPPGEWDPSIRIEPPKNVPSQEKRKTPGVPNGTAALGESEEHEGHSGPELQRTGRLFGGLILDIKRKAPFFWSDFRDAFSLQCLASFLFLYCACMSPVITFGGLLGEATEGRISAIESLFGASMTGIAYSLFGGQPLTILGSTGPVLVFEKILFKFCKEYGLSYLSLRASIGLWTAFNCIVLVATDASSLVCYITRFTEEAFAALICVIFIYEALEKLIHLGENYPINMNNNLELLTQYSCSCAEPTSPSNETLKYWDEANITTSEITWNNLTVSACKEYKGVFVGDACGHEGPYVPDVLFWSIILFFSTVTLSSTLKQFKTSRYFPTKVRSIISDFAVFLTIMSMVLIDYGLGIPSPKLQVPSDFKPTRDDRGWLVNPLGPNPWWTVLAAIIPSLLCTILIFMDQQITAVIINRKEHKLKKGCGYHLDLLMVGVMLGVCSVMGLPWFVAATVLSITHVNSLKLESECSAPGEQPKFLGIREQRVTGLMIFVLMGSSVFMTRVLQFIPMPVLYGVFLYMGASSLKGIQFYDRIMLFWMPPKHQPDFIYLRHVPLRKVHLFTVLQLTCLILLWVIKVSRAAIVFPMMVLALVFVRKLMDFFFTKRELSWLDDLMPESKKKKLEDAEKEEEQSMLVLEDEGTVQLPMEENCREDPSVINISDEMAKTSVWKTLLITSENAKTKESSFSSKSTQARKRKIPPELQFIIKPATAYKGSDCNAANNTREFFKVAKELANSRCKIATTEHSQALCQQMADYFAEKIQKLRDNIPMFHRTDETLSSSLSTLPYSLTEFQPISEERTIEIIGALRSSSSPLDPCPAAVVKSAAVAMAPYIRDIINSSVSSGQVPAILKQAVVTPLPKKPALPVTDLSNLRPISGLPFAAKIGEREVVAQLQGYLEANHILDNFQSEFRPGRGTETALVNVQDDLLMALDQNDSMVLVLLDLSSAFDTIDHQVLLNRLKVVAGLNGKALAWIVSFLRTGYNE